jgi:selenocysteine-specific elongation factor
VERHVVIGTAGHVDHGKTALVKALTGTDTDRWAEEKRRGITIDIGFAVLELGSAITASIVDVPGHEDFVRNMVAGAAGIDVALLVVAADEGVMPQTVEHLAILEFLGVKTGVAFITKSDVAEAEWLDLVREDLAERLGGSSVEWSDLVVGSAASGDGLDALRATLANAAETAAVRSRQDLFRVPVDRVFSVAGAGTVVTGTAWSGSVEVGDEVRLLPGDGRARVRSIEVHGMEHKTALPGRRTALALVGLNRKAVGRGHVVVAGESWRETESVDVMVTLLPGARRLTQRSRVRFHLGTAEVMARVVPVESTIAPGSSGAARLRLEAPVVCRWGDAAVLRSYSPVTTIGGCIVVDPWPAIRPRRPVDLEKKADIDPGRRLLVFVEAAGSHGLRRSELPVRLGVEPRSVDQLVDSCQGIVDMGDRLVSPAVVSDARDATLTVLQEYHRKRPLELGMPRELARRAVRDALLAEYVHKELTQDGQIALEGQTVRLVQHKPDLRGSQVGAGQRLMQELQSAGKLGRTLAELGQALPDEDIPALIGFLVMQRTATRVGKDRYYDRDNLDRLLQEVLGVVQQVGRASPAQLKEGTGLSRKYLIPLLEWMDAGLLTVRDGDGRALGPKAQTILNSVDRG